MQAMDDMALLQEYAAHNSETAFETLVARRINFVHSAALRQVRDPLLAGEVTQAVFIILAQKAGRISGKTNLTGWLFRTTRFTALAQMRAAARRHQREQEAGMQSEIESTAPDPVWQQLSPLLDEALAHLGETDRTALLLRFFENQSLSEVGSSLGTGEDTARKRVSRALEKLRKFFAKRGVVSTSAVIAGAISANSVQAAPPALVKTISVAAAAKGAAAGSSTLTLLKGALKLMAWTHAKTAVVVGVGILLAAGTTTVVVEHVSRPTLSATDLSWADDPKSWATDSRVLEKLPSAMIIRPTRFPHGGSGVSTGNRILDKNYSVGDFLVIAYNFNWTRTIFPDDMPTDTYDLLYTMPAPPSSVLPQELARRFGYVAHEEIRETNVFLLEVVNPNPPNLKRAAKEKMSMMNSGGDKTVIGNQGLSTLAAYIEGKVGQPVLDRTKLYGNYDVTLYTPWKWRKPSMEELNRALLDQLGLELVPSREPIEMLVIEKAP
jgi:uncharacterized protein (TIGR03435 family)